MADANSTHTNAVSSSTTRKQLSMFDLANLRSLLKHQRAQEILTSLAQEAEEIRSKTQEEMISRYGVQWDIWIGFHAVPSLEHLHLHVISSDLFSSSLKNKKHYNSFHPKEGFFLHLDQVLEWFDTAPSYFASVTKLAPSQYEPILKRSLACWRCGSEMTNIPALKEHLELEWNKEIEKAKNKAAQALPRSTAQSGKRNRDTELSSPRSSIEGTDRRKRASRVAKTVSRDERPSEQC